MNHEKSKESVVEDFVAVLGKHHAAIYGYVASLVITTSDADDVVQETCIALWRKFSEYDADRPFFPWACSIAYIEILRFRQKMGRSRLLFNDEVFRKVQEGLIEPIEVASARRAALLECLNSLDNRFRSLVHLRYEQEQTVQEISTARGKPKSTVYKMLLKARSILAECVEIRLRRENQSHG